MASAPNPDVTAVVDEPIEVARIRLQDRINATVVLSDFRSADRVLACWANTRPRGQVAFEVTYADGQVACGCYAFGKRRERCSLGGHVRRVLLAAVPMPEQAAPGCLERYLIPP
jgi:hypothetical protein